MQRFRSLYSRICLMAIAAAAAGCGDAGTPPELGGDYTATVQPPGNAADGAAVLELNGAGIEQVTPLDAQLFTERSGNTVRVVVVRETPGTIRFGITLARGSAFPQAAVLEVADGNNALRTSLAGYNVRFTR